MVDAKRGLLASMGKTKAMNSRAQSSSLNHVESIWKRFNLALQLQVKQQTGDLRRANEQLQRERSERQCLEAALQAARQELHVLQTEFKQCLEEEVTQRTLEVQLLHNLSKQIGYTLNYEDLFRSMLENLHLVVPCDATAGILIEGQICELFLKAHQPLSTEAQADIHQCLFESLAKIGGFDASRRPLCLHNLGKGTELAFESASNPPTQIESIGDRFLVPIIGGSDRDKQIVGILFVGTERKEQFTEEHIRLLYAIANQASISVRRLRSLLTAEQHRLENEKIRHALAREQELNELKSRAIRTISHEYRTPLTIISLAAESLESYYAQLSAEQRQTCFQQIQSATQHLTNLINDVLWVNRSEAGEMTFDPKHFDLIVFCRQIVEDIQLISNRNQKIHFVHDNPSVEACLDRKLLRQILVNLLSNATKYSPEEEAIDFHLTCCQNRVIFLVRDRGIGIPPEDRSRLFEPFHRASNVGTLQGTGLGLAIVKKCIDLHGGEIGFESDVGRGTTFTVKLPLVNSRTL